MDFADIQTIASYLKEMSPNYERIRIYDNVTDDSGITGLYSVTGKELTKYIVCYGDVCYLIESDYDILEVYLFKGDPMQIIRRISIKLSVRLFCCWC